MEDRTQERNYARQEEKNNKKLNFKSKDKERNEWGVIQKRQRRA